jgi:hypothetical protein
MSRIIEQKQMKDFLKLYTGLVERCFESCCNDFTSKALSSKEVGASSFREAQRRVDDADTFAGLAATGHVRVELHPEVPQALGACGCALWRGKVSGSPSDTVARMTMY